MDKITYAKKIDLARKALVVYGILWAAQFIAGLVIGFQAGFSGSDAQLLTSPLISWFIFPFEILLLICGVIFLWGFWAIGKKYKQNMVTAGSGMLAAIIVFGFANSIFTKLTASSYQLSAQNPILYFLVVFIMIEVVAAACIMLGKGLRKLEGELGPRAQSVGKLFFLSGIFLATIILGIASFVMWIILYFKSYKFFAEELVRVSAQS